MAIKTLITPITLATLAGLAGAAAGAQAADPGGSTVTLYGVVDVGVAYTHAGTTMIKQISGMGATSRLGFIGTEDLGGGLKAGFRLESSLQTDAGTAGSATRQGGQSLFNRDAHIWIGSERLGMIKLGKQTPSQIPPSVEPFVAVTGFSPFASLVSGNADLGKGATIGDSRVNNVVSYITPEVGGFGGQVHYAPREDNTPGFPRVADYGAEAHYAQGDLLYLGVQYDVINSDPVPGIAAFQNRWSAFGAQYRMGPSILSYELNIVAPRFAGYLIAQNHMLGLVYTPRGTDTFKAQLMYRNVAGDHARNALALGMGYEYNLSKSTAVYSRLGYVLNKGKGVSTLSGITQARAGDDVSLAALGIRQRF
jgi:predicted porin